MIYTQHYDSPLGGILLAADESGLTGLWFDGGKHFAEGLPAAHIRRETPILAAAKGWLDIYFTGREPDFLPPLHPAGSLFQQAVWALLLQIPYGQTVTYGQLAARLAAERGLARMSAPNTRWQGMMREIRLRPTAPPTACADIRGLPCFSASCRASSP